MSVRMDLPNAAPSSRGTQMRKILSTLIVLMFVGTAAAQPAAGGKGGGATAGGDKGGQPTGKVKVYDFSGDTIEGDLIKPEGSSVDARNFAQHSSLIRIRKDFIPEIIKSAEDL